MKKFLARLSIVVTVLAMEVAFPQHVKASDIGNNSIAPAVNFVDGKSNFGVNAKIGIIDNFSLRPYVTFPANRTNFGTSLTYDFGSRQSNREIAPFVGLGIAAYNSVNNTNTKATIFYQAGLDANINESLGLFGNVNIPSSRDYTTSISIGAGLRF